MIDNYDSMPIGVYLDIQSVLADKGREETDKDPAIVALLTGLTEDEVWDLPLPQYTRYKQAAAFLFEQPAEAKLRDTYKVGEFICTYPRSFRHLCAGQFSDFDTISKGDAFDKDVALLSVLLVPQGKRYCKGYDILELRAAIRCCLSVTDAQALVAFFFSLLAKYVRSTLSSLARMRRIPKEKRTEMKEALSSVSGAGSHGWTQSLTLPTEIGMRYYSLTW